MSIPERPAPLKTVLVVYSMTYMPTNYDSFICELGEDPRVFGAIFINNVSLKTFFQGLVLMISLAAPRLGLQIIINYLQIQKSWKRREKAFAEKKMLVTSSIHSKECIQFIQENEFNFLIHSRTVSIFKEKHFKLLPYGSINVHHGILPKYRGLMCDFWAHYYDLPFGFSIHLMTSQIDDGPVIFSEEITKTKNYLKSAYESSVREAKACTDVLNRLEENLFLKSENQLCSDYQYFKAPGLRHGYMIQFKGILF